MHYEEMVALRVYKVLQETLFGEVSSAEVHLASDAEYILDMPKKLIEHFVSMLGTEAVRIFAWCLTPGYGAVLNHDSASWQLMDRHA